MTSRAFILAPLFLALAPLASAQRAVEVDLGVRARGAYATLDLSLGRRGARRNVRRSAPGYSRRAVTTCAPRRVYVPGHYQTVTRRVWVPGQLREEYVPATYETRLDPCGRPYNALIRAAHYRTVQDPGYWEDRGQRVWVPARWEVL